MSENKKPKIRSFLTNLQVEMPISKKIYKLFRNNLIKIYKMKNCCGHHGEPGCWQVKNDVTGK